MIEPVEINSDDKDALDNLVTHRRVWRDCIECTMNDSSVHQIASYWEHELSAFDATMKAFDEQGEVVVTKNERGQIVMVSRQDDDHRILKIISMSEQVLPEKEELTIDQKIDDYLGIEEVFIRLPKTAMDGYRKLAEEKDVLVESLLRDVLVKLA